MQFSISQLLSLFVVALLVPSYQCEVSGSTSHIIKLSKSRKVSISKADESTMADLLEVIDKWDGSQYSKKLLAKMKEKANKNHKNKDNKSKKDKAKDKVKELEMKKLNKSKRPARIAYLRPLKRKSTRWSRLVARKGKWTYGAIRVQDKCPNNKQVDKKIIKEAMSKAVKSGKYYSVNCDGDILQVDKLSKK